MEGVKKNPMAKFLLLAGLVLMAGGGIFYSVSLANDRYGLIVAGLGLAAVLLAALVGKSQLSAMLKLRSARMGLGAGAAVLAVLALTIFLGALAVRHHVRWDLSANAKLSLAPQTIKILKDLKKPVKAIAFFRQDQSGRPQAQETLDQYAYQSRQFSYRFVDPDHDPAVAKRYQVRNYGTVVLTGYGKEEQVKLPEEQALTNALIRLTRKGKKTVYFLGGHGERSLKDIGREDFSSLQKAIEGQNYAVKPLVLITADKVPEDAAVVVMAAPTKDITENEKTRLAAFLKAGGGLLIMIEPQHDVGMVGWLKGYGVEVGNNVVLDQASQLFGASPAWPVALQYGQHQITAPLEGVFCYFPVARSVTLAAKMPPGITGVELVKSSEQSWGEADLESLAGEQGAQYDEVTDLRGPVGLGVVVNIVSTEKPKEGETPAAGKMVVFGDADFANNTHLGQAGNQDLMLNSISFLAEEADLVSIRAKKQASQPLLLQPYQARLVFWIPVVLVPLAAAILGLVVVIRRRRLA